MLDHDDATIHFFEVMCVQKSGPIDLSPQLVSARPQPEGDGSVRTNSVR